MWKQECFIFERTAFQFSHKQERLQVLWFVKFWSCKRRLSKQLGIGDINNIYVRARLKPGWVRWVFHFTFEWLWIFTRPNLSFSRPKFFHWNLGCFAQGRFQHEILRSLPLSRFTVERDRTFPTALFEKKKCFQLTCCRMFQFLKRPTVDMIDCVNRFLVLDPVERRNNFSVMFFGDQSFWRRNVWRKNHVRRFHACYIYIYLYIYIYYMKRLLQISDKVSGSRWKLPTQPVSSRNK